MEKTLYNSTLIIDLKQSGENFRSLESLFGEKTSVIPVIKGDAFGLGLIEMAKVAMENMDVKCLAVAHIIEGVRLREADIGCPILILGGVLPDMTDAAVEYDLTVGVGRLGILPKLAESGRKQNKKVSVQLAIDTGLGRLGVRPGDDLAALINEVKENLDVIKIAGTYSHFGNAETEGSPKSSEQYKRYLGALKQVKEAGIEPGMRHMSNSGASEWFKDADFDAVRLGRRLFFDNPTKPNGTVKEVATWRTRVTNIKHFRAGDTFAYGKGITLDHDADIALIGVGYGDGLRHALAENRAPMLINGKRAKLLSLCMDQSFVDVTGIDCEVGDEVTLFGWDSLGNFLSAQEVASYANDEGCGLTAMITPRVKRIYVR